MDSVLLANLNTQTDYELDRHKMISSEIFDQYIAKAKIYADLLEKNFGKTVSVIEPEELPLLKERFQKHSVDNQLKKYKCFTQLVDYYQWLDSQKVVIKDRYLSLDSYIQKMKLKIVGLEKFSHLINENSLFEIYNSEHMQVYRSIDFLFYTNYSLMTLETSEWWELFTRTSDITVMAHAAAQMIFIGAETGPILNPVPVHTVKELSSVNPRSTQSCSLAYAPIHNESDELFGLLHVFEVEETRSISFSVV